MSFFFKGKVPKICGNFIGTRNKYISYSPCQSLPTLCLPPPPHNIPSPRPPSRPITQCSARLSRTPLSAAQRRGLRSPLRGGGVISVRRCVAARSLPARPPCAAECSLLSSLLRSGVVSALHCAAAAWSPLSTARRRRNLRSPLRGSAFSAAAEWSRLSSSCAAAWSTLSTARRRRVLTDTGFATIGAGCPILKTLKLPNCNHTGFAARPALTSTPSASATA